MWKKCICPLFFEWSLFLRDKQNKEKTQKYKIPCFHYGENDIFNTWTSQGAVVGVQPNDTLTSLVQFLILSECSQNCKVFSANTGKSSTCQHHSPGVWTWDNYLPLWPSVLFSVNWGGWCLFVGWLWRFREMMRRAQWQALHKGRFPFV